MADEAQIYRELMRFKPDGLTPNGWAIRAGVSRTVWADMRRHGNPSRRTLEKLLKAAGSSLAEFEALRVGGPPQIDGSAAWALADRKGASWRGAQLPGLPLLASEPAGCWAKTLADMTAVRSAEIPSRVARPASLAQDASAYAVKITGHSMWPR